ncbi:cytochrome P450 [Halorussus caseinilyticus]|uniref:Cytochrome P450 n=1 Tax=Halorussus caseinilyticus TaxID=3034025 RepID=A0ABD5WMP9_9EURY|nr:cytochrome P450 [Halorussus sp. DT72]
MSGNQTPPGPSGLPLVGSMPKYGLNPFEYRKEWAEEYGDIVYVDGGLGRDGYILSSPELFEKVLVEDDEKYQRPREFREVFREGIGASEGEFWRQQREMIQPAFYPQRIKSYAEEMKTATEELIEGWSDGETLDIEAEMKALTLDVFARTAFGIDDVADYPAIKEACEAISDKTAASNQVFPSWFPTPANRRYEKTQEKLNDTLDRIIRERADEDDDTLLSVMIDAEADDGHQMSTETLRNEMITLMFAGHETTALALTYAFHLLSNNENEREQFFAEVDEVVGDEGITPTNVRNLDYTNKIIKETLRLRAPGHTVFRQPQEPVTINGYEISDGAAIFLPIWLLHHDEQYYDDPMAFRPERWDGTLERELPKYAYAPFGAGPHRCIGERFGKMELRIMLPTIAREFELDYVGEEPLEFEAGLAAEPKNEMLMDVTAR